MRRVFVFLFLFGVAGSSSATMFRVVAVQDSRTIIVESAGRRSVVILSGVTVDDEAVAAEFLRGLLTGTWVLVEGGDVYRSPDALYVNGEMLRRAWRTSPNMRYLGESDPAPRTVEARSSTRTVKPKSSSTPARRRSRSAKRARR